MQLQFTGWLQFLPVAAAGVVVVTSAFLVWLVTARMSPLVWVLFASGAAVLGRSAYELVTLKLGWHPSEAMPLGLPNLDVFELMRARRSCRSFQRRDLTAEHRAELLAVAREHTQPERLIGGRPIRLEYIAAPLTVWPVLGAHEFFVAIAPKEYDRLAVIDVGRSLQKVVIRATRMGVATCWIGPGADQRSVIAHLGARFDPARDHVICVCALGYRSGYLPLTIHGMNCLMRRRLPLASLFFSDAACTVPLDVNAPPFATYGRCYEACQWSPSSYNEQTTRCVAVVARADEPRRVQRFDFRAATTSRYYAAVATGIWCANWELGCEALGLRGHFAVAAPEDRGELPRYDVSWVVDLNVPQEAA